MTDIKRGDRVRLTIEGEWGKTGWSAQEGELTGRLKPTSVTIQPEDVVTIEKIEPPVVQFRAGTLLRRKADGSLWYLTRNGYVRLGRNDDNGEVFYDWPNSGHESFTSNEFEPVTVD